jgi:hypothetical protein
MTTLEKIAMKRMMSIVALPVVLGSTACGGGNTTADAGAQDAAADVAPIDSGATACSLAVAVGNFGTLSPECLPRCTAATLSAISACTDGSCVDAALRSDPTSGTAWSFNGAVQPAPLTCHQCFSYQNQHCFSANGCASEVDTLSTCVRAGSAAECDAEFTALDTCAHSTEHGAAIMACVNDPVMGTRACFGD